MKRQPRSNTAPELALRRELFSRGLRYRVNCRPLKESRRTADILFSKARVACFCDGCFWHQCPEHGTLPKRNAEWWAAKLRANVQRDRDTDQQLVKAGWIPVRIWEHESPIEAADRIQQILGLRLLS
jgi:DNA mismatch endonuclease (patch repair protein)